MASLPSLSRRLRQLRLTITHTRPSSFLLLLLLLVFHRPLLSLLSSSTPPPATLAIFIQASNFTLLHLPRLLTTLYHPSNHYLLHLDAKIPLSDRHFAIRQLTHARPNVHILPSEPITYAGVTMLVNTINAIETLLSHPWDFFINLSAADYPLVSPVLMRQVLAPLAISSPPPNFLQPQISTHPIFWFRHRRLELVYIDPALWMDSHVPLQDHALYASNVTHPLPPQRFPPLMKTEAWTILHRTFATYAVRSPQARRLQLALSTARASDELYFGTLLTNSMEFNKTLIADAFRFIHWQSNGKLQSRPIFLDDLFENNRTLTKNVETMIEESGALFARKFHQPDSNILDWVDRLAQGEEDVFPEIRLRAMRWKIRVRERIECAMRERANVGKCMPHR